ncbi:MAG: hypothetical protein ACE5G8_07855 [Anaerolineae bacterium]
MKMVYRREEIYNGEFVAQAPDIVFEFAPGYKVSHLPFAGTILTDVSDRPDGFHEREGIFAVSGPGVKPGAAEQPAIIEDVMPTTLYALGLPVPDDLDGRVLGACFTAERLARQPVQFQPGGDSGAAGPAAAAYSGREETLIEDRLRGLGYLE